MGILPERAGFFILKQLQFQLLTGRLDLLLLLAEKNLYFSKLLVSDTHNAYLPLFGEKTFDPLDVHLRILHAGAMTDIGGELKHGESIVKQTFTKVCIDADVMFCHRWQIEEYHHPHNSVLA